MTKFYLRVEAVNLAHTVEDTEDLSTVRGGGLALLRAVEWVGRKFGFEAVTLGASAGIFEIEAADAEEMERRRREVEQFLAEHSEPYEDRDGDRRLLDLGQFTFVTDVTPASGDFALDRRRLVARNRFRQMQSPSLVVPAEAAPDGAGPCEEDRLRPAAEGCYGKPRRGAGQRSRRLSRSVSERREFGRAQKQAFYEVETDVAYPGAFSNDFAALSADPGDAGAPAEAPLAGKMAVLYLDGNRFGRLQDEHCATAEGQRSFDEALRGYRRSVLRELLAKAKDDPGFLEESADSEASQEPRLRFETLLWGGDELLWAVPAARGLWTLGFFYGHAAAWSFAGEPLTFAGGLVLCHHNAPIYRVRALASELAGLAKRRDRGKNLFAYQVLESFDHAGADLEGVRRRRTPKVVDPDDLVLDGGALEAVLGHAPEVRRHLPRRRVEGVVRALQAGAAAEVEIGRARRGLPPETAAALDGLLGAFGGGPAAWLHLADLWDYLEAPRP